MRSKAMVSLGLLALGACATGRQDFVEQGYERGSLGVAAIARSDWAAAEQNLNKHRGVAADNPARLINLGTVYMETGRPGMALTMWRLALASERHEMVETKSGKWVSTRALAEQALARHEDASRSASR